LEGEFLKASLAELGRARRATFLRWSALATVSILLLLTIRLALTGQINRFFYQPVDMQDYWVTIPAGDFQMGSNNGNGNEIPVHTVYLDEYKIGKYEITNKQYNQCLRASVCTGSVVPDKLDHPVVNVNWHAAKTYCEWVGGRLPTEAEWEKAASWDPETKTKFVYPWGNDDPTSALLNYRYYVGDTSPVGSYPDAVSPYGLFDMAGNVWEWMSSVYQPYPYSADDDRENLSSSEARVLRGGAWDEMIDDGVRSAHRGKGTSTITGSYLGFRCSRDTSP
ncbi:MAG TPA: SUMF1/EgtB/PvdO family nonheme iron enzyme, partial [Anaerolineales bacterium]|nr:SUMF1/EgtB/PvdO family nonheme iron enzyme [Anaerolineales bacterium]